MPLKANNAQILDSTITKMLAINEIVNDTLVATDNDEILAAKAEFESNIKKTIHNIPNSFVNPMSGRTVKYEGGKTIERSSKITYGKSGLINKLASPDDDGFMKLDNRYLIAVGSRFDTEPGQYIDLVLQNGIVIKCIMGDAKADVDTDATNTFTYRSRCCSEFIIDEDSIRTDISKRGNASLKNVTWNSPVVRVVVYDDYHDFL